MEIINSNKSFELILIDGKFEGDFSSIDILSPSSPEICEVIIPELKKNLEKSLYSSTFKIDKSNCSKFKWWIALLITFGILIVIAGILLVIVYGVKPLRQKFLPFSKRKLQYNGTDAIKVENKLYKGKSKSNPIFKY